MTCPWIEVKTLPALFRLLAMLALAFVLSTSRAQADADMTMSSGGDCTDPIFSLFTASLSVGGVGGGGGCLAFPNFSGGASNVQIKTAFSGSETFFCSGGDLFANCDSTFDGGILTILFSGGPGIPATRDGFFTVNLNSFVPCDSGPGITPGRCQPTNDDGAGGWGSGHTFEGTANVPEPNTQLFLLLCGAATLLARALAARRRRNSQAGHAELS